MADTIQDIIERIESARDRFENASDDHGVMAAKQALVDLRSLSPTALTVARDIEEYFLGRTSSGAAGAKGARESTAVRTPQSRGFLGDDDLSDNS